MPNELWKETSDTYKEIAESKLGKKKSKPQKPFITEEVFELCKEKSQARKKGNREKYKQLKKEIRAKIRRDKVTWLKEEHTEEIERIWDSTFGHGYRRNFNHP